METIKLAGFGPEMFTLHIPETQVRNLHRVVASHMGALKNWTASAVESGDLPRAQGLVEELRQFEALFAATNVEAKYDIARFTNRPLQTEVTVEARHR